MILMQKHKLVSFVVAVLVAILLWVYAVTVVNPDDQISVRGVPVRITGTNELQMNQLMLTGGEVQYVDVEIAGRRSDLKELNNLTLEAVADVGRITGPGTYELSWILEPPSTVATGDIKLVSSSTNKIKVRVSEYVQSPEIPVQIEYRGVVAEGYVRDSAVTNLDTITVSGPAEEIEKITCARIVVELENTKTSLDRELEYELIGEDGEPLNLSTYVEIHDPMVRVMVPVYCYKQIQLALEIIPGGGASEDDVIYEISPSVIGVIGDEDVLKELPTTLVIKTVKLGDIRDDLDLHISPELPDGVSNRDQANSVHVTLRFKDLSTRTIYVQTDRIIRENDDESLQFTQERIPITVRGSADMIHRLSADMITVVADMVNGFDSNTMKVELEVYLEEGLNGGVLGKYTIAVTEGVKESEPNETTSDR